MSTMWFFANPCDHGAVTRLENVYQLNKRRGKKLDISLLLRHPLTYKLNYLLTNLNTYLLACLDAKWSSHIKKKDEDSFSAKENFDIKLWISTNTSQIV